MVKEDVTSEEKYISVVEAAKIMGYSRIHVVRLIHDGKVEAKKVGRSYVVDRSSIGGVYKSITMEEKREVDKAVDRVFKTYSEALRKLSKE